MVRWSVWAVAHHENRRNVLMLYKWNKEESRTSTLSSSNHFMIDNNTTIAWCDQGKTDAEWWLWNFECVYSFVFCAVFSYFFLKSTKKTFIVILHSFIKKKNYTYNENTAIPDPFFSLNFSKTLYSRYYNLFLQFTLTSVSLTLLPKSFFQIVIMVHRLTFRVTNNNAILGSYADI